MIICVFVTLVVMAPNMNNDWVNWDDELFILDNPLVDELSSENVKAIFTTLENNGGYTPLVVLSWSLDYFADGYNAQVFHTTNVLLHLLNVCLVFLFIFSLSQRMELAVIVALLFGIHPMQLEAVAWITSRKDLLYGLFYLAGLITYLKYLGVEQEKRRKVYVLCLLFFLGSLLSKGMAVTFPVALLVIDFFKKRKDIKQIILEKVPFLVLSVVIGLIAVSGQQQGGAVDEMQNISFSDSFFVACYGLTMYSIKALIPFGLSSYHPYPYAPGEALPTYMYAALVPALLFVVGVWYAIKKNRFIAFGLLFFLVSIALMLQFFPVGLAIISERFSYIAYIGLFFLVAYAVLKLTDRYGLQRKIVYFGFAGYLAVLGTITFQRSDVWENSETLWSDVIEKYPDNFLAYANRGGYYFSKGELDQALTDYDTALVLHPNSFETLNDRGFLLMQMGDQERAMRDFDKAISINQEFVGAYINRGLIFMNANRYEEAMRDFDYSVQLDSLSSLAFYNRGQLLARVNRVDEALENYSEAIRLDERGTIAVVGRADLYVRLGKSDLAKADYEHCLEIDPDFAYAYFSLGRIYLNEQNLELALSKFERTVELDSTFAPAYINLGLIYLNQKNYPRALEVLNRGLALNPEEPMGYFNRGLVYNFMNNHTRALADLTECINRIPKYGSAYYWRSVVLHSLDRIPEAIVDAEKAERLNFALPEGYVESLK